MALVRWSTGLLAYPGSTNPYLTGSFGCSVLAPCFPITETARWLARQDVTVHNERFCGDHARSAVRVTTGMSR